MQNLRPNERRPSSGPGGVSVPAAAVPPSAAPQGRGPAQRAARLLPRLLALALALFPAACGRAPGSNVRSDTIYSVTTRFRGYDPAFAGDQATIRAVGKVYEGLYEYDYWTRPYRTVPLLAAAPPDVSPDGLVWRIRIRPGIFFSDDPCFPGGRGREVVADDFVYSFKRIADAKIGSNGYWIFRGKIRGLDDFFAASAAAPGPVDYALPVDGLRALSRYELEIRLLEPYPQLAWVLAMPYTAVVPHEAVDAYGRDFANHPVGTGPYILESARHNYRYAYVRNPAWSLHDRADRIPPGAPTPDAGRLLPLTDRVVDLVIDDPSTMWLMFLSGEIDRCGVSRAQWESVVRPDGSLAPDLAARGIRIEHAPRMSTSYYAFNMDDPVVGPNRPLRQAIACAFDAEKWRTFMQGRIAVASSIIPPGVAGHDESGPAAYPFDLERARALMAEAGYPGGIDPATGRRLQLTLEIGNATDEESRQAAELFASMLADIGIVLRLSFNNWPTFLQKLDRRQAQIFGLQWLGDYPDAQNFLQLFHSDNVSPGPNHCNYVSDAVDAACDAVVAAPPGPARDALCGDCARLVMRDAPWVLSGYPVATVLSQRRIRNDRISDFDWAVEKFWAVDAPPPAAPATPVDAAEGQGT